MYKIENKSFVKNKSGSALLMVMASSVILGIIGYGVINQISNVTKNQKIVQAKSQQKDAQADIKNLIQDPATCASNFIGQNIPANFNLIQDSFNTERFKVGGLDRSGLLRIQSIKVENFVAGADPLVGVADLNIIFAKKTDGNTGLNPGAGQNSGTVFVYKPLTIKLKVTLNNTNLKILTCLVDPASTALLANDEFWSPQVVSTDINYSTGNIGVGVIAPTNKVEINGDAGLSNSSQKIYSNVFNQTNPSSVMAPFKIFPTLTGKLNLANNLVTVANFNPGSTLNYAVGIGKDAQAKFDVNGEIRLASTTNSTCDNINEGVQRYNSPKKCMEFCNGSIWQCIEIEKPQDCVGAYSVCDSGTGLRPYIVFIPADTGGAACAQEGTTDSTGCSAPVTPPLTPVCTGHWGPCVDGGTMQDYIVTNSPPGAICSPANGATRVCNNTCTTCPAGWTASGANCVKSATTNYQAQCPSGPIFGTGTNYYPNGGGMIPGFWVVTQDSCTNSPNGGTATCECEAAAGAAGGASSPCHGGAGADRPATCVSTKSCSSGSTLSGNQCSMSCPTGPPVEPPPPVVTGNSCVMHTGCFVAGTKVLLSNGKYKSIEKIKAGEKVISFDEENKIQRTDIVMKPLAHKKMWQTLHHFQLADGTKFTSNSEHPFYVVEKNQYQLASEIYSSWKSGEKISFLNIKNKSVQIKKIGLEKKFVAVYNLAIKGLKAADEKKGNWGVGHNYYVNGILVHNKNNAINSDGTSACTGLWHAFGGVCVMCPALKPELDSSTGMCCPF